MSAHLQRLYDSLPNIRDVPLDLTESGPDHEVDWLQNPT
jgi:hypothetical protein